MRKELQVNESQNENKTSEQETPRWREDFPIGWERDHYVTRRDLAKFLTLGSAVMAAASSVLAVAGRLYRSPRYRRMHIAQLSSLPRNGSILFRYPTAQDPCILVRSASGELSAYSQVCTHLSCAVVYWKEEKTLYCPCHRGQFDPASGRPTAGPPQRRLPRIQLDVRGDDVYATGVEV